MAQALNWKGHTWNEYTKAISIEHDGKILVELVFSNGFNHDHYNRDVEIGDTIELKGDVDNFYAIDGNYKVVELTRNPPGQGNVNWGFVIDYELTNTHWANGFGQVRTIKKVQRGSEIDGPLFNLPSFSELSNISPNMVLFGILVMVITLFMVIRS